jgi:hypothetical protein
MHKQVDLIINFNYLRYKITLNATKLKKSLKILFKPQIISWKFKENYIRVLQ